MPKPQGLKRRKLGYYIRVAVPTDLRNALGQNEIVRSLKTPNYNTACTRCLLERIKLNSYFETERLKLKNPNIENSKDQLSHYSTDQLKTLAIEWIAEQDEKHEQQIAENGITVGSGHWEEVLQTLREDKGTAEYALGGNFFEGPDYGAKTAADFLKPKNISFIEDSPSFKRLSRFFREALVEVAEKAVLRHKTERIPKFINPNFEATQKTIAIAQPENRITFEELIEEYTKRKSSNWSKETIRKTPALHQMLKEIIGKDTFVDQIDRQTARRVQDIFTTLPTNLRKKYPAHKYSFLEAHRLGKKKAIPPVKPKTANTYISVFVSLMKYAQAEQYITHSPTIDLQINDPVKAKDKRQSFSKEQLNQIFKAPLYTGCQNAENGYNKFGTCIPRESAKFWAPLLALWTGMRLGECLQLECGDITVEDGIDIIYIRESSENTEDTKFQKRVKNKHSIRYIPIHPELKKIGFLEFVMEAKKSRKSERLFPEVKAYRGSISNNFSKWFNGQFLAKTIENKVSHQTVFHSFRHNYRDAMRNAKLGVDVVCALGGWTENSGIHNDYGSSFDAQELFEEVIKIKYKNLDLSHLYIKSLEN